MLGNIEEQWHLHHRENIYICYIESHIHDFPFNIKQPKQFKGGGNNNSLHCISERKTEMH